MSERQLQRPVLYEVEGLGTCSFEIPKVLDKPQSNQRNGFDSMRVSGVERFASQVVDQGREPVNPLMIHLHESDGR